MAFSEVGSYDEEPVLRVSFDSPGPDATQALGRRFADVVSPGDVLLLGGPLGAGKTVFVRGLAAGLGCDEPVTSPTFVLVRDLGGRIPLRHSDLYRLTKVQEVIDLGADELLDPDAVAVIEWGEAARPIAGLSIADLTFAYGTDEQSRSISIELFGQDWVARAAQVEEMLDRPESPGT